MKHFDIVSLQNLLDFKKEKILCHKVRLESGLNRPSRKASAKYRALAGRRKSSSKLKVIEEAILEEEEAEQKWHLMSSSQSVNILQQPKTCLGNLMSFENCICF